MSRCGRVSGWLAAGAMTALSVLGPGCGKSAREPSAASAPRESARATRPPAASRAGPLQHAAMVAAERRQAPSREAAVARPQQSRPGETSPAAQGKLRERAARGSEGAEASAVPVARGSAGEGGAGPDAAPTADATARPRIHFDDVQHDFGPMQQEQESTHRFVFRNVGRAPLEIEKVRSDCGCTAVLLSKQRLAPGEEGTLDVTFHSGRFRDRVTKHVYVDSNDPLERRVTLTVTADVKVEVDVIPRGIYLGRMVVGDRVERSVDLVPVGVKRFRIVDVRTDDPLLRASKPEPIAGQPGAYRIRVTYGPAQTPGRVAPKITIRTDLEHTGIITVVAYGQVDPQETAGRAPGSPG